MTGYYVDTRHKQVTNAMDLFIWQIILCFVLIHSIRNPYLKIIELRKSGFIIKYKRPIPTQAIFSKLKGLKDIDILDSDLYF